MIYIILMKKEIITPNSWTEAVENIKILELKNTHIASELRWIMLQEMDFHSAWVPGFSDSILRERSINIEDVDGSSTMTTTIWQWLYYRYIEEKNDQEENPVPVTDNFPSSATIPTVLTNEWSDDESIHAL